MFTEPDPGRGLGGAGLVLGKKGLYCALNIAHDLIPSGRAQRELGVRRVSFRQVALDRSSRPRTTPPSRNPVVASERFPRSPLP
jgi:hypothetical protein